MPIALTSERWSKSKTPVKEAGPAIENAEADSAIECFCNRIVVSQTD
jgi:hypothetical protein